jgi:hypothetical protein
VPLPTRPGRQCCLTSDLSETHRTSYRARPTSFANRDNTQWCDWGWKGPFQIPCFLLGCGSIRVCQIIRRHIPEDRNLQTLISVYCLTGIYVGILFSDLKAREGGVHPVTGAPSPHSDCPLRKWRVCVWLPKMPTSAFAIGLHVEAVRIFRSTLLPPFSEWMLRKEDVIASPSTLSPTLYLHCETCSFRLSLPEDGDCGIRRNFGTAATDDMAKLRKSKLWH